jgi:predicted nucleic acid-binding protein
VSAVFVDTSVLITWFHAEGEHEVEAARALLAAHTEGVVEARVLDLAVYELGNVLTRSLRWPPDQVTDQVEDLLLLVGPPVMLDATARADAAALAAAYRLTYYDASWAAVARRHEAVLVSADRELLAAGLAVTATAYVANHEAGGRAPRSAGALEQP